VGFFVQKKARLRRACR